MKKYNRSELVVMREAIALTVKNLRQQSKMIFGKFLRPGESVTIARSGMEWMGVPDIEGLEVTLFDNVKPNVKIVTGAMLKSERENRLITGKKTLAQPADIVVETPKKPADVVSEAPKKPVEVQNIVAPAIAIARDLEKGIDTGKIGTPISPTVSSKSAPELGQSETIEGKSIETGDVKSLEGKRGSADKFKIKENEPKKRGRKSKDISEKAE